ncbi:hypothetical protein [Amycolatopsis taiwanensis]|uniref:Uncharacterized protein n=1 Tax=Amycolatopsis taiwanensis TaxID=342230 RepID=A0A9W6R471_9PSEU|nr:hypothetical protein [Amycolatopsis taiwanensis]GLY67180.1 hypothetical protein Atai01_37990 [Amycolatopsis taiwanensis]
MEDNDNGIENHPDLMDPDWQRHAEKEAWVELRTKRRRARRGRRLAWTAAALVAVLAVGFGIYRWRTTDHNETNGAAGTPGDVVATTKPSVLPEIARVDLARPFDNTPAQSWADSVDGLTVPAAEKIGTFSAAQVQSAYDKVKQSINAGQVDRRVVEGHDTSAYLALLSPRERDRVGPILADRSKNTFSAYVAFAADGFHLLPAGPKITGRLSARPGGEGELVVHAEYVVAYAFDPGSYGPVTSPADIDIFWRHQEDYSIFTSPPYVKSDAGLTAPYGPNSGEMYPVACRAAEAGYLAPWISERATTTGGAPATNEAAIYDLDQPMPTDDGCEPHSPTSTG